ncbi:glycosyl hydrolase family 28 protein [uncultured Draconibacterium sp.]|uniref:glycosyl hydrolase family 28 protein n=1 Tax=uncultured Draconibacterium sp. TaxID=1573823 RepID=UPI0029C0C190|nr:glycosyl hydrolase family 28 protein [uncultured Draconibacterium sp.]
MKKYLSITLTAALLLSLAFLGSCGNETSIKVYDAPPNEKASNDYKVWANNNEVFCYDAQVYDTRFTEGKHFGETGIPYSTVSFGYFDFSGKVKVSIKVNHNINTAVVRPLSRNIKPVVKNNTIEFYIDEPGALTIEPDGSEERVLHLFANPMMEKPNTNDENIIYYGPGEHVLNTIKLKSNQTLFVDGGAVLYFDVFENDSIYRYEGREEETIQLKRYDHGIEAIKAKNIKIKGRGIIDFTRVAEKYGRKNPIHINNCENVEIEGVILRGANCWHATIYRSKNVVIDNLKEIAWGFNTDGINIVLSQDVHIKNCFMRQRDDGIIMKSMDTGNMDAFITEIPQPQTTTSNVTVEDCVIWSDWGYALGVTYETRMPVHNITFRNCDIIHATHAVEGQGVIGILVADSSRVTNVNFENITIERSLKPLIKLEQKLTAWTVNKDLGIIRDVHFSNIKYLSGKEQPVIFKGFSEKGNIEDVYLDNLEFLGKKIETEKDWEFRKNEFVEKIKLNGTYELP